MKYYLIAGEASGDLHGARLIEALNERDPKANIRCWGGDMMEKAGATLVKHYRELAFMGFWEVLINLPTILKNNFISVVPVQYDVTAHHAIQNLNTWQFE